jgi:hypothetical protein
MDARKWRIHKRAGKWQVFEPGWVFHAIGTYDTHGMAVFMTGAFISTGSHTKGRREQ